MCSAEAGDAGSSALERRLAAAESLAHVGTFELRGGKVVGCSPEFLRIYGYTGDERPADLGALLDRVHADDRAAAKAAAERARASGTPFRHRYRVVRPGGAPRVVEAHGVITR